MIPTPVQPETPMQRCLRQMREKIKRIEEAGVPWAATLAMDLRHQMIELVSLINDVQGTAASKRMTGEAEQIKPQASIDETPLFALAAAPRLEVARSAEELERMERTLHRVGDHSLDSEEGEP